jgi:WD40 repeat protein
LTKHTILFLAANPLGTDRLELDREARAIHQELKRCGYRDCFELATRWAAEPLDLLRELRELKPTVVHFSGHAGDSPDGPDGPDGPDSPDSPDSDDHRATRRRDVASAASIHDPSRGHGLFFQGRDGRAQFVSAAAVKQAFGAAGASVKVIVLSACYSDVQAAALVAHADCVVGMGGAIGDDAARSFAIGFYGALGERESVATAYEQGRAAISLEGLPESELPKLHARHGVDLGQLILASTPSVNAAGLIDFTAERQRHLRFLGRADVLRQLDAWLDAPGETGWVFVTGGPGMGKSAILSAWLARREATGATVPHHLIRRQVADWDQPEVIAASLAAQIEIAFPTLRDTDAKPERRLLELLGRVSKQLGTTKRLVVVVDGLDETRAEPGKNPLPRFLPHVVPPGIRFLCATRPTYPHLNWIEARSPVRRLDLDDARWAASNDAVVTAFWTAVAAEYRPALPAGTIALAITRAEGNALHSVMLHDALRDLPADQRHAGRIPRGLKALIGEVWDRAALHEHVRRGLGILCAAREALSMNVLAEISGWSYDETQCFLPSARQLLLEEPASWDDADGYRPRHEWVRELIADRLGSSTVREHHATLSRTLATWPARSGTAMTLYTVRHALIHRAEAGDWDGAWRLAADMSFVEAKCRRLGVHETEVDLAHIAERCRASDDARLSRWFADLAGTLRRESHWLRVAPAATAGLVWNRLRQSGWSEKDLGERLYIPAETKLLRLRHWAKRQSPGLVREFVGHSGGVTACAVMPDGQRMISASEDRTLKLWDLATGEILATLRGHTDTVSACAVAPDGRRVVSASWDGTLKLWDISARRVLATFRKHEGRVRACSLTPDGRWVVSASEDGSFKLWELDSGRDIANLRGHARSVSACLVTPDGRRVVSASHDRTLRIWALDRGTLLAVLKGHTEGVRACAVSPDGRRLVSASQDLTLKIWDLETLCVLCTLNGHADWVTACAVTPDGQRVVSASEDRTLKVWDLGSGRVLATIEGHTRWMSACVVTQDSRRVISASGDETVKIWDLDACRVAASSEAHTRRVKSCAIAPDGRRAVSASEDHTAKVWDIDSGRVLLTFADHRSWVSACTVAADGRCVISASHDQTLKVWELDTGRVLTTLEGHRHWVRTCAVTPDGRRVVSASYDGTMKVWELDGRVLATLQTSAVTACAVTPDGRRVIAGSGDGTLAALDLEDGGVAVTFEGHTDTVTACAVTPDGRNAVSASKDGTLKVWELDTGRLVATYDGHTDRVSACAVTTDGRRVLSVSEDRTLKVWDLGVHRCILTYYGDTDFAAVAVMGASIVAGDNAGAVLFLDWPSTMETPDPLPASEDSRALAGDINDDSLPGNRVVAIARPRSPWGRVREWLRVLKARD